MLSDFCRSLLDSEVWNVRPALTCLLCFVCVYSCSRWSTVQSVTKPLEETLNKNPYRMFTVSTNQPLQRLVVLLFETNAKTQCKKVNCKLVLGFVCLFFSSCIFISQWQEMKANRVEHCNRMGYNSGATTLLASTRTKWMWSVNNSQSLILLIEILYFVFLLNSFKLTPLSYIVVNAYPNCSHCSMYVCSM